MGDNDQAVEGLDEISERITAVEGQIADLAEKLVRVENGIGLMLGILRTDQGNGLAKDFGPTFAGEITTDKWHADVAEWTASGLELMDQATSPPDRSSEEHGIPRRS